MPFFARIAPVPEGKFFFKKSLDRDLPGGWKGGLRRAFQARCFEAGDHNVALGARSGAVDVVKPHDPNRGGSAAREQAPRDRTSGLACRSNTDIGPHDKLLEGPAAVASVGAKLALAA